MSKADCQRQTWRVDFDYAGNDALPKQIVLICDNCHEEWKYTLAIPSGQITSIPHISRYEDYLARMAMH